MINKFNMRVFLIRAVIMASADHNIEGNSRLSNKDGAGGIDIDLKISDCYLTPEILDQLIAGKYPINGFPSYDRSF